MPQIEGSGSSWQKQWTLRLSRINAREKMRKLRNSLRYYNDAFSRYEFAILRRIV
ncbi:unnamed protein product [Haemonchus placei]|uniref:Transposase n=1 Tax=Haemonchus placei TaxID=6290 RepID=A0A0N4X5F6_HAEPC|nr:unnamed protein product [Haemonchus placei]